MCFNNPAIYMYIPDNYYALYSPLFHVFNIEKLGGPGGQGYGLFDCFCFFMHVHAYQCRFSIVIIVLTEIDVTKGLCALDVTVVVSTMSLISC